MNQDNKNELLPLVDPQGRVTGNATRGECHSGSGLLHPVVHLHLFNPSGELYLQRRPLWKDIQPGKWDTAVGGHIDYGETVEEALLREAREELGINAAEAILLTRYVFECERERELINAYTLTTAQPPHPTAELDGGRFWPLAEIRANLGRNIFTPNFEQEFRRLFS